MARKKKSVQTPSASAEEPATATAKFKSYVGIIDTLGLDSFGLMDGHTAACMKIRAMSNPHRYACLFIAEFEQGMEPEKHIKKMKNPWDMWAYIQMACTELKCEPKDARTIKNMKELADSMIKCTGTATGITHA